MKFLLVFQMCYSLGGACLQPMQEKTYDTFRECSLNGYEKARKVIVAMPKERVEDYRTIIKFWCEAKKIEASKIEKDAQL